MERVKKEREEKGLSGSVGSKEVAQYFGVTSKRGGNTNAIGPGRIWPHKWGSVPGGSQGVTWLWGPPSRDGFYSGMGVRQTVLNDLRPRICASWQPHKR